jgi:hypothetical protein
MSEDRLRHKADSLMLAISVATVRRFGVKGIIFILEPS